MRKRHADGRRQFRFRFHRRQQPLGKLPGAAIAGFGALHFLDPVGDVVPRRVIQRAVPAQQSALLGEDAQQFGRDGGGALPGVGFQAELRRGAGARPPTGLHALVHQQDVRATARGEQRAAEREAVDVALHFQLGARSPDFRDVERDARHHPVQARGHWLQRGLERLGCGCGHANSIMRPATGAPAIACITKNFVVQSIYATPLDAPRNAAPSRSG